MENQIALVHSHAEGAGEQSPQRYIYSYRSSNDNSELNTLSHEIIDAAIKVHKRLGPGLLEPVYRKVLTHELRKMGYKAEMEVPMRCIYDDIDMGLAYRADIIVEDEIIVELKSTEENHPIFYKQLLSYLKVADKKLGLLINFSQPTVIQGLKRIVNNF